jgi:DNA methyltransferase 1-associated protein 1
VAEGPSTKAAHTPAFIRSAKIPWLKNNSLQPKIIQAFTEMGLSPSRLVMPTKENVAALESLIEAVTAMAETKRHLDKVEYDIEVAKKQLQTRAEGGDEGEMDGMDVDETAGTETDGNEGRGQSIASARSMGGRTGSRKKVRSMRLGDLEGDR